MRFMTLYKPGREADGPTSERELAAVGQLIQEMTEAGVLITTDGYSRARGSSRADLEWKVTVTADRSPRRRS